jgi:hypothetical protein
MKRLILMLTAVVVNCLMGATFAQTIGADPLAGAGVMTVIGTVFGNMIPAGSLGAGVYTEVWTGELVKFLRRGMEATFLDGIPDASSLVNNDVIHLVEVGVDPDVLINNTTYPIPLQALDDADIAIQLDKFQTKVTPVTDDELYAISYDKMTRVKESHGQAIHDSKFTKAAHALCATQNTATTPVLKTTGSVDSVTGRRKMVVADLVSLKRAMDSLKVPVEGRRLVLCNDHVNDLLETSQAFKEQYNIDRNNGTVGRLYGFDIYEYANNPLYTTAGVKKALGASADAGEFQCSFAFYTQRVFKATGSTKMYYSEAGTDPEYQRNKINFRHYFICLFKKADAGVVMMSDYVAPDTPSLPTISGDDSLEVAATSGSNNRTYATSNGAPVTASTTADWLTVSASGNKVTFTRQAYAYDAEGEATRTATVVIGIEGTEVTKNVTVTQAMASNQ